MELHEQLPDEIPICFAYHPESLTFAGSYQCDPDPETPGEFLLPANTTLIKPDFEAPHTEEDSLFFFRICRHGDGSGTMKKSVSMIDVTATIAEYFCRTLTILCCPMLLFQMLSASNGNSTGRRSGTYHKLRAGRLRKHGLRCLKRG